MTKWVDCCLVNHPVKLVNLYQVWTYSRLGKSKLYKIMYFNVKTTKYQPVLLSMRLLIYFLLIFLAFSSFFFIVLTNNCFYPKYVKAHFTIIHSSFLLHFSYSCALLELWNDGTPALDLPGLLAYRNGEDRPPTMTLTTDEPQLKTLLHSMTERNPRDRRTAELYLDEARGK